MFSEKRFRAKFENSRFESLQDGKQGWNEVEFDAGDGFEAEEAVFDLSEELGVDGFVGGGGVEGDVGDVTGGDAGDVGAAEVWGVGVGGEGGGADEAGGDDVAAVGEVAVAEEEMEVEVGHGLEFHLRGSG
jgi:hypothetical protein